MKKSRRRVTPDELYLGAPTRQFIRKCIQQKVSWAIFSDLYGVWFPGVKHKWYDKPPDSVSRPEFLKLVNDFDRKLSGYKEIWFYTNHRYFHPLYKKLLRTVKLRRRIHLFYHLSEVK